MFMIRQQKNVLHVHAEKKETYALFVVIGEEYDYSSFGVFPVD
jgi:hypothetical protein